MFDRILSALPSLLHVVYVSALAHLDLGKMSTTPSDDSVSTLFFFYVSGDHRDLHVLTLSFPTRRSSDLLTVVHEDDDGKAAFLIDDNGPVPAMIAAQAKFASEPDDKGYWRAPAPRLVDDGRIEILSDSVTGNRRTIRLAAVAPSADRQELLIEDGKAMTSIIVNGARPAIVGEPIYIGCTGRTCRRLEVQFEIAAKGKLPEISWRRTRYGAGEEGAKLTAKIGRAHV